MSKPAAPRLAAMLLGVAYLPSLFFLGHFDLRIDVPGTGFFIGLPGAPASSDGHVHSHGSAPVTDSDNHAQHCHEAAATCSDIPLTTVSPVAHLAETVAFLGACCALVLIAARSWRPTGAISVIPDAPPPRLSLAFA